MMHLGLLLILAALKCCGDIRPDGTMLDLSGPSFYYGAPPCNPSPANSWTDAGSIFLAGMLIGSMLIALLQVLIQHHEARKRSHNQ